MLSEREWIKCCSAQDGCLEAKVVNNLVAIRNSNYPDKVLFFSKREWQDFLDGTAVGLFDINDDVK